MRARDATLALADRATGPSRTSVTYNACFDQRLCANCLYNEERFQCVTATQAKKDYKLPRQDTTTGADRFHDSATGMDLVVIPTKAMLFSDKDESRLADECMTAEMAAGAAAPTQSEALKQNPLIKPEQ